MTMSLLSADLLTLVTVMIVQNAMHFCTDELMQKSLLKVQNMNKQYLHRSTVLLFTNNACFHWDIIFSKLPAWFCL